MHVPFQRRGFYMSPEGPGGSGGGSSGGSSLFNSAMSLFHRGQSAQKPNAVIDPSKFKFDPETGKPISADPSKPNTEDPSKSVPNPLESFKDLWQDPNSKNKDVAPEFKLDPEKLKTLAGSLDFSQHLTPELQEKLKSGDPQAMQEALNGLGRSAYTKLMEHMPALTEAFVNARLQHSQKNLGTSVKSTLTKQSLDKLAASNPVLKKQLEVVGEQLLSTFPDASPDWIAEQTPKYFVEIARLVAPDSFKEQQQDPATTLQPGESSFDWGAYLEGKQQPATNK